MDKMRYRGPESVLDALLSMDESKSMSRKSTMKISERKLKKIIREETKKAINEIDLSKEFKTIGKFMEDVSMSYGSVRPIGEKTERGEKVYEFEINGAIFQIKPLT
jgi:D-aminopeptidase